MDHTLNCPKCDAEIEVNYDMIMGRVICTACGAQYGLDYEEGNAGEHEFSYFWFEPLTSFGRRK